jgi:leucyl-tRNA synthetase
MNEDYNHFDIEAKWQKIWDRKKAYEAKNSSKKKKHYVLDMFPYPSGKGLHVGHPKGYIGSDVYARMKRMQGYNVLHPMGYDAFGLPAEQYALEHNIHPRKAVEANVATFEKQLKKIGLSFDWSRKINTTDPEYYRWTQWIFLRLYGSWYDNDKNKAEPIELLIKRFEKEGNASVHAHAAETPLFGKEEWKKKTPKEKQDALMNYRLAFEGYSEVNWCPTLGTVLANDEIVDGPDGPVSERGGYPVEKKRMRQWFLRITAYADRLLRGLETLDWSSHIKEIERNWIGKSEGSELSFEVINSEFRYPLGEIKVFTTRADTLYGVTYVVLAPEHPLVEKLLEKEIRNKEEAEDYRAASKMKDAEDRMAAKEKTGALLEGISAVHPITGEKLPVWISDYVLSTYGTGAVMAVPAHDERDFEFAKKFGMPAKRVVEMAPFDSELRKSVPFGMQTLSTTSGDDSCYTGEGYLVNSGKFSDMPTAKARKEITKHVKGKVVTNYKMRDAIFARQRYWGEPIPLKHDKNGLIEPLKDKELPLKLPEVRSYQPTGTGEGPLAGVSAWTKKGLETNTMPGWAGSSWYFLRYMDPKNKRALADRKALNYWKDVDMYVGGAEHATGHLLYARFWHKFLKDIGVVPTEEPFLALKNQGLILGPDGRKMSKRWGNTINPDDIVDSYGADTLRLYEMFMGPFEASLPWNPDSIIGSRRFLDRIFRMQKRVSKKAVSSPRLENLLHRTVEKVGNDIDSFAFNTAVSAMMILLNEFDKTQEINRKDFEMLLKILCPFAPHMTEEIWQKLGHSSLLVSESWPKANKAKMKELEVNIAVQINSKVRAQMLVETGAKEEDVVEQAKNLEDVAKWLIGKEIRKVVYIKDKLLNLVVF